mmetsp:Transcript_42568/g.107410  ORF Transcript_42568/g.107410 Transcript_42568/m.107410 type:complete len:135 (-) Transcript_42568:2-406(-)
MVCKKCQKKLKVLATPEKWRDGARDRASGSTLPPSSGSGRPVAASSTVAPASAANKASGNKLLQSRAQLAKRGARTAAAAAAAANPYGSNCRKCRAQLHQPGARYCQACAFKRGVCAMCGKVILDTTMYKQSSA